MRAQGLRFLHVRPEHHSLIDPLVISHGWRESGDFVERNEWQGTRDFAPFLTVPTAIDYQQEDMIGSLSVTSATKWRRWLKRGYVSTTAMQPYLG